MYRFTHTKSLIDDIDSAIKSTALEGDSPIINLHLMKVGILSFSSEMESDLKELISKKITGYKNFCQLCHKLRNPKVSDINDVLKELSIDTLSIEDSKKSKYSNIIVDRDKTAHVPDFSGRITLNDLKEGIIIGEEILDHIQSKI